MEITINKVDGDKIVEDKKDKSNFKFRKMNKMKEVNLFFSNSNIQAIKDIIVKNKVNKAIK